MSFLPHKKFTWADFGGIYPDIPPPVATPLDGKENTNIDAHKRRVDKPDPPSVQRLLDAYYHRSLAVQGCVQHTCNYFSDTFM